MRKSILRHIGLRLLMLIVNRTLVIGAPMIRPLMIRALVVGPIVVRPLMTGTLLEPALLRNVIV